MAPVAVVADSCHYLPAEMVERFGIRQVSLHVNFPDGTSRPEEDITDLGEYYSLLGSSPKLPTTSQPSVGEFLAVWEPILDGGSDIVSVCLSSGLSGTFETAELARAELGARGERVAIVDSETTAGGEALIVLAAISAAQAGKDAAACAEHARATREQLKTWLVLDTLEYVHKGGRIGRANAWVGTALKVKPILNMERELTPFERVRTSGKAFARMVELLGLLAEEGKDGWLVQHVRDPESAAALVAEGRKIFGNEPVFVSEIGPVIGTYSGPRLLAIGGVPRSMLTGI